MSQHERGISACKGDWLSSPPPPPPPPRGLARVLPTVTGALQNWADASAPLPWPACPSLPFPASCFSHEFFVEARPTVKHYTTTTSHMLKKVRRQQTELLWLRGKPLLQNASLVQVNEECARRHEIDDAILPILDGIKSSCIHERAPCLGNEGSP